MGRFRRGWGKNFSTADIDETQVVSLEGPGIIIKGRPPPT